MFNIEISDILKGNFLVLAIVLLLHLVKAAHEKLNITSFLFKPRIWWRSLIVFIFIQIILIFWKRLFDNNLGIGLFVSMTTATIWLSYTIWRTALYEQLLLRFLFRKKLDRAESSNIKISQARFFLTTQGKFLFYKKFINFSKEGENKYLKPDAFAAIDKLKLFEKQKAEALILKCCFYLESGAYSKLQEVIAQTNSTFIKSWEYSYFKSELCRTQLDFEGWRSCLLEAEKIVHIDSSNNDILALLFNSLAVVSISTGNKEDHKRYLLESIKHIDKASPNKHSIFPNYIDNLLLTNEELKYTEALDRYKNLIDFEDLHDVLAWYNYLIEFARQINETDKICHLIDEMDILINNKFSLSESERAIFAVSGLRMRYNGNCEWNYQFAVIAANIHYYLSLPQETARIVSKELIGIMTVQQNEGHGFKKIDEVADALVKFLKEYYKFVDKKTDTLKFEFVNERCNAIMEKADIIARIVDDKDVDQQVSSISNKIRLYKDVIQIYFEVNDKANELAVRLKIIDEIRSLNYSTINAPQFIRVKYLELHGKLYKELEFQIKSSWSLINNNGIEYHPELNDKILILSYYFYRELGDLVLSKILLEKFENSGVGINHYTLWLRNFYKELKTIHNI